MDIENMIATLGVIVVGCLIVLPFGTFRINTGEGMIITHLGGNKDAMTDVGWHFVIPVLEGYQRYPIVNDYIYFPSEATAKGAGGEEVGVSGVEINAKDDTVVDVSAITYFDRTDLYQWGVKNVDPDTQFERAVSGIIRNVIQTSDAIDILHNREAVAAEIFAKIQSSGVEKQYGVRITGFTLQHSSYIDEVVKANAHKQALSLEAEGRLNAAQMDAQAIRIRADAGAYQADLLKSYPESVLSYMANIELYSTMKSRTGDVVWITPTGVPANPTFIPATQ